MEPGELRDRMADNPFYVLGLRPSSSRADAEREGAKLLGMLELGLAAAATYATPLGPQPRTPEKVREAMGELRDPERRLRHELWARAEPVAPSALSEPPLEAPPVWETALTDLGCEAPVIPVAGLVGVYWIIRALTRDKRGETATVGRGSPWLAVYLLVAVVGFSWLIALAALVAAGELPVLIFAPFVLAMVLPGTATFLVLIPLGRYRLAYLLSHLAMNDWRADPHGGRVAASAWALLNRKSVVPEDLAWIEKRLVALKPLRGGGLLAAGLLSAARGDADGARAILESIAWLDSDKPVAPATAAKLAAEYLMAEAAARGDWARVGMLASRPNQVLSRAATLLAAIARKLLKQRDAPAPFGIWLRWLWAPHRLRTLPFVRRVLAYQPHADLPAEPLVSPADSDSLVRALRFHAALASTPASLEGIRLASTLWDEALAESSLSRHLAERTLALESADSSGAIDELRRSAAADLAARLRAADLAFDELGAGSMAAAIARAARDESLAELESLTAALSARLAENRELPGVEEWRELMALRSAYERAARGGGDSLRRLAFSQLNGPACTWAVRLWNARKERALAHAAFSWLRDEAQRVGDGPTFELQAKNAKLGS